MFGNLENGLNGVKVGDNFIIERGQIYPSSGYPDGSFNDCVFVCRAIEGTAVVGEFLFNRYPWSKGETHTFRTFHVAMRPVSDAYVQAASDGSDEAKRAFRGEAE